MVRTATLAFCISVHAPGLSYRDDARTRVGGAASSAATTAVTLRFPRASLRLSRVCVRAVRDEDSAREEVTEWKRLLRTTEEGRANTLNDLSLSLHEQERHAAPIEIARRTLTDAELSKGIAVLWFRRNLRVHDNEALTIARRCMAVLPVYIFDPAHYGTVLSEEGFQKTGPHKAHFIHSAVEALRKALRGKASELFTAIGPAESKLIPMLQALTQYELPIYLIGCRDVSEQGMTEERAVRAAIAAQPWAAQCTMEFVMDGTLFDPDQLPRDAAALTTFQSFEQATQALGLRVSEHAFAFEESDRLGPLPNPQPRLGTLPDLASELGVEGLCEPLNWPFPDSRAVYTFRGGEPSGLERMEEYIFDWDELSSYAEDNRFLGSTQTSSKLSAWFACGALSVRAYFRQILDFEKRMIPKITQPEELQLAKESLDQMKRNLVFREYLMLRHCVCGPALPLYVTEELSEEEEIKLDAWIEGETGFAYIDAMMSELKATGWIAHVSRMCVASFLFHDLGVRNTRVGIEYFASVLVDYEEAPTVFFWNRAAASPRIDWLEHALYHDPDGWYTASWCRTLCEVPVPEIFTFHHDDSAETRKVLGMSGVKVGYNFIRPIILPDGSLNPARTQSRSDDNALVH
ncbi:Cryptochrome DASH [Porphyridium purpureum]|uniref:Cryptochrome DASH n=1 Tax=Porphyridium purpureum TaxID=35688 RepID=A0A5J4Z287_PORPP|nr:Cryptochrome DASH [Porphyridium purpureum]|eukprot:POR0726..scf208_2